MQLDRLQIWRISSDLVIDIGMGQLCRGPVQTGVIRASSTFTILFSLTSLLKQLLVFYLWCRTQYSNCNIYFCVCCYLFTSMCALSNVSCRNIKKPKCNTVSVCYIIYNVVNYSYAYNPSIRCNIGCF